MGRYRVHAILLFVVMLLIVAAASASQSNTRPAYLKPSGADFTLNSRWTGARQIKHAPTGGLPTTTSDPAQMVWAAHCGAGKQTAVFSRDVDLFGPPTEGTFNWVMGLERSNPRLFRWPGIQALTVEVNGHAVYRWSLKRSTQMSVTFTQGVLALLKIGTNKFDIRATRAALPHGFHQCNNRGHQPVIAISAEFSFSFGADLRVGVSMENPRIVHGTHVVIQGLGIANNGPDRAVDGYMLVLYSSPGSGAARIITTGGTPENCETANASRFECHFTQLDPGQQINYIGDVTFTPPAGLTNWNYDSESLTFQTYSPTPDPNSNNDSFQQQIIFCQDGYTSPPCDK